MIRALVLACASFFLAAVLVTGGAYWMYANLEEQSLQLEQEQVQLVVAGDTPRSLLQKLEEQGVITGTVWLRSKWRLQHEVPAVQIGEYSLTPGMTLADLLEKWRTGDMIQHRVTLVEGWTFARFREALAQNDVLEHQLGDWTDAQIMDELGYQGVHPEGRFYPDTYQFTRGQSDLDILRQAGKRLHEVLESEWAQRTEGLPYASADQALVMASIIEKETGVASERPAIAGVFVRRLNKKMLLQTDPTVIYGMGESYQGRITRADLQRPTPYNTYVVAGLPPTPIAMVGRAAIHAALHPAEGDALYFVAKGDGSHQFSRTLQEHNRAVREYQLKRRADYRSSPAPIQQAD